MTATLRALSKVSAVTWVALAIIAAQLAVRGLMVARSWFFIDDHIFMADIARGEDDLAWYSRLHQGHFMPLSFLMVKLVVVLTEPYSWTPVVVQILVLQAFASIACWWMLRTLFGPSRTALVGLALYATTAMSMPALTWWAVAINQYPHQVAFFGAITAHVLYARTRRLRWVGVATLFLVIGYTTYAKTGLVVVTLALLTLIWLVDGAPWDRFWSALRRFWVAWVAYGTVSVAWLFIYVTRPGSGIPSQPSQFLELTQAQLFEAALPALIGGPLGWVDFAIGPVQFADPPLLLSILAPVVVALVLLQAWGTRERALLVLWPVGIYLFASALLVYTGRSYTIGLLGGGGIGIHVQYLADGLPLFLLAGVSLFKPLLDVADPPRPRAEPLVRMAPPAPIRNLLVVAVMATGLISSFTYAQGWWSFNDRTVNERAIAELRDREGVRFADTFVPATILASVAGEKALVKNYFALLDPLYSTSLGDVDLSTFDDEGNVVRADVVPPEGAPETPDIKGCREVGVFGERFVLEPPPVLGPWLAVEYRSTQAGKVSVGGIGVTRVGIEAPAGRHRLLVAAPRPRESIVVAASEGTELCVTRVEYGFVEPE